MNLKPLHFLAILLLFAAVSACSKGGDGPDKGEGPHVLVPNDTTPPQVLIFSPTDNQVYTSGSTVRITGRLTDDLGLYRGTISIVNDASGASLLHQPYVIHGLLLYNFDLSQQLNVTTVTNCTVTVSFEDHGLNMTTKSVKIKVTP